MSLDFTILLPSSGSTQLHSLNKYCKQIDNNENCWYIFLDFPLQRIPTSQQMFYAEPSVSNFKFCVNF